MEQQSTILIVDDERIGRETLEAILFSRGYNLVFATNAKEALTKAIEVMPDLILLDVMMPGMNGFDACRCIRQDPILAEVPIILLTALDDRESRLKGIEAGADDFISKPFDKVELRGRIQTITRLNRYRRLLLDRIKIERAEAQIREQAALLDQAQDAIFVQDMTDNILFWNKGAENLYGWTKTEALGCLSDLLYKNRTPPPPHILLEVQEKGYWLGELSHITKNRQEVLVQSRWTLVKDEEGKPKSILIVNTDITAQKRLEAQFLRAQRMENIGTLASGISHDLNNILSPILLASQLLQSYTTDARHQRMLTMMETAAQRGIGLIRQVLSFGRGVEGQLTTFAPKSVIIEMEKIIRETFPKSIQVNKSLDKDLWLLYGDVTQFHQVLLNLCINARDAMPEGGTLSISAKNFKVTEADIHHYPSAKVGSYIVILVSDTGTGIEPEIIDKIFEPFFTTKESNKGTGLGLSTVISIVRNFGGFIEINSEVGQGTPFSIYLPTGEVSPPALQNSGSTELLIGHGEMILIVDDEASIREITKTSLETYAYNVLTASTGMQALSIYQEHREAISIVMVDLLMPLMDGKILIQQLKSINPTVKVILISGSEPTNIPGEIRENIKAFLFKPYIMKDLLKVLNEALNHP